MLTWIDEPRLSPRYDTLVDIDGLSASEMIVALCALLDDRLDCLEAPHKETLRDKLYSPGPGELWHLASLLRIEWAVEVRDALVHGRATRGRYTDSPPTCDELRHAACELLRAVVDVARSRGEFTHRYMRVPVPGSTEDRLREKEAERERAANDANYAEARLMRAQAQRSNALHDQIVALTASRNKIRGWLLSGLLLGLLLLGLLWLFHAFGLYKSQGDAMMRAATDVEQADFLPDDDDLHGFIQRLRDGDVPRKPAYRIRRGPDLP